MRFGELIHSTDIFGIKVIVYKPFHETYSLPSLESLDIGCCEYVISLMFSWIYHTEFIIMVTSLWGELFVNHWACGYPSSRRHLCYIVKCMHVICKTLHLVKRYFLRILTVTVYIEWLVNSRSLLSTIYITQFLFPMNSICIN